MPKLVKLIESGESSIWRGNIFRVRGIYPYEDIVDFMVFETQQDDRPYGLLVSSGYKAGLILVRLPEESCSADGGLDKKWIIENWEKWIYPDCALSEVYLIDRYQ